MDKVDWQSIGYAMGMAACTGAKVTQQYPYQDTCTPQDEADFIAGRNGAIHDYHMGEGYQTLRDYGSETIAPR